MGLGLVLFWPALFFLSGGKSAKEAELSRMKGEYDALQQAAIQRNRIKPPPTTTASVMSEAQTTPPGQPTTGAQPLIAATPQPPAPQQQTVTPQPAVAPATARPVLVQTSSTAGGPSKYMINAERHAKANGCTTPVATMTIASPNYEVFTLRCGNDAEPRLVRCDYGVCKSLQ